MGKGHALLSPSAAHRWLHCTAAPRLESTVEDRGSTFAEEGTLAHAYCARKLKKFLGQDTTEEDREIRMLRGKYHTGEMDEHTDEYAAFVLERLTEARRDCPDARLLVEVRLDLTEYIPEAFGTADAVIIADGRMEIIDFKYGRGVEVSAKDNPQMKIYALGALELFAGDYDITNVRMTIVQPRLGNYSTWSVSEQTLGWWGYSVLRPQALVAFDGENVTQEAGEWCRFCKVRPTCKALAAWCAAKPDEQPDAHLLTPAELARDILPRLATIKAWLTDVDAYALQLALDGTELPGWKLVEGRSVRKITNPDGVVKALTGAGYAEAMVYKPRELCGITDLERLAGKKNFAALCGAFIDKPAGKPTLAPESDKRPAITPAALDFQDIDVPADSGETK